jgi:hypothetical protein
MKLAKETRRAMIPGGPFQTTTMTNGWVTKPDAKEKSCHERG